ncbi:MAG: hypothetical protein H6811_05850 [Phycisphaeraceae bacterium]|nr:hypothetical protein [Phycisphaeraceae bacterium]
MSEHARRAKPEVQSILAIALMGGALFLVDRLMQPSESMAEQPTRPSLGSLERHDQRVLILGGERVSFVDANEPGREVAPSPEGSTRLMMVTESDQGW